MSLYSLNQGEPRELPFKIKLSNGQVRTDPSSFTAEELADVGYVPREISCFDVSWVGDVLAFHGYYPSESSCSRVVTGHALPVQGLKATSSPAAIEPHGGETPGPLGGEVVDAQEAGWKDLAR